MGFEVFGIEANGDCIIQEEAQEGEEGEEA
jgi:hypothetical protein